MDELQLVERLQTAAPSCLQAFKLTLAQLPEPFDDNPRSVWQIACRCGGTRGRFLGYPLKDYNTEYDGPECFLSPLEPFWMNFIDATLDRDPMNLRVVLGPSSSR